MKLRFSLLLLIILFLILSIYDWGVGDDSKSLQKQKEILITWVDNNMYWFNMAKKGLVMLNPETTVEKAIYTGNEIKANSVKTLFSSDIPVTDTDSRQSENSVFVNPNDESNLLNSNNSMNSNLYGANDFYSFDGGENWDGELQGAGTNNSGDPVALIGNDGRYFVGYITSTDLGQGVSYSDDNGQSWTYRTVANSGGATVLDKNHMWIDNSLSSSYEGRLYDAWTPLGGYHSNNNQIELSYSSTGGDEWTEPQNISEAVSAKHHNQGVNINTGPDGEVYAVWAIYDNWPGDENALGFARSFDGGQTWEDAFRIIENIRGIRLTETSKKMRVNSYPVMTTDHSGGTYHGTIYTVWTNIGEPGINTGNDIDIYMIKSSDKGDNWSEPIRINQDEKGQGHEHFFPWITCDKSNGVLSVIFYDDRNVDEKQCEVFCANSFDGGEHWEDFKVSDVAFTPEPIPDFAPRYFGDYLGITAKNGKVYPVWTDNRTGKAMSYISPYEINDIFPPTNLTAQVDNETGKVDLLWSFNGGEDFEYFKIYRNNELLGTTVDTFYTDQLPDYGIYEYKVTAFYSEYGDSPPAVISIKWGDAQINIKPDELYTILKPGDSSINTFTIYNTGELELTYNIINSKSDIKKHSDNNTNNGNVWFQILDPEGTVSPADSANVRFKMNAKELGFGNFYDSIVIMSNDPVQPELIVPVRLMVSDIEVESSADPQSFCSGESVDLFAEASGGFGEYSYRWYSIPQEYSSNEQNPSFENVSGIWAFVVEVTDSLGYITDTAEVNIFPLPFIDLGSDTIICAINNIELDAGEHPGANYLWSTGEITQTIIVDTSNSGMGTTQIWVTVTSQYQCTASDSIYITFIDCTGIKEYDDGINIDIYPNPSNGIFSVSFNLNNEKTITIQIIDQAGNTIYQRNNLIISKKFRKTFYFNNIAKGIYSIFIFKKNKELLLSKKIIIN